MGRGNSKLLGMHYYVYYIGLHGDEASLDLGVNI